MITFHAPPRSEMTLCGRIEFFLTKQISVLRGDLGSRLELAIEDLPTTREREKLTGVLDALDRIEDLTPLPRTLKTLLDEIHGAMVAISLPERHQGLLRAAKLLIENDVLRVAANAPFNPPNEVISYNDALLLCRLQLNLAVQRLNDFTRWSRPSIQVSTQAVAREMATAHWWILQAGGFL